MSDNRQPPKDSLLTRLDNRKRRRSSMKRGRRDQGNHFDVDIFSPCRQRSRSLQDDSISPTSSPTTTQSHTGSDIGAPPSPSLPPDPPAPRADNLLHAGTPEEVFQLVLSAACVAAFKTLERCAQRAQRAQNVIVDDLKKQLREPLMRMLAKLRQEIFLEWLNCAANHPRVVNDEMQEFMSGESTKDIEDAGVVGGEDVKDEETADVEDVEDREILDDAEPDRH